MDLIRLYFGIFHLLPFYPFHLLEAAECTCNGYITPKGQGECKTTYKVFKSSFCVYSAYHTHLFIHILMIQWNIQEWRHICKKIKIFCILQGATFCFVEEGKCKDQLRAKYQYPGTDITSIQLLSLQMLTREEKTLI